jgi:drug/metabolite transporter (DMT)-like permease
VSAPSGSVTPRGSDAPATLVGARLPATARPYLVLAAGVAAISSAAILISLARAEGVPALSIAALRLCLACVVVVPVALARAGREILGLARRDLVLCIASGLLLAAHFASWTSSFDHTSVMSSVVFVSTNPVFVGIASALVFRERLGSWTIAGIIIAAAGGAAVGILDLGQAGGTSLRGDLLALAGAVCGSGYILLGRSARRRVSLTAYVGVVYAVAAVALLGLAAAARAPLAGFSSRGWLWVALLAVGPQLVGHTSYNWALKYVTATFITVTLLSEPIGATLLAIPILSQVPSPARAAGGVLILAGIVLAARAESRKERT